MLDLSKSVVKLVEWSPEASIAPRESPTSVLLLLRSLSGGGAERVAVNLVKSCDPALVDVRLGLLRRDGEYLREVFDGRIVAPGDVRDARRSALFAPTDIAGMIDRVRPEVLMSFGMGVDMLAWLGLRLIGSRRPRWICRLDNNPIKDLDALPNSRLLRGAVGDLSRRARASADATVAVSADMAKSATLDGNWGSAPRVIHNPIDIDLIEQMMGRPVEVPPEGFIVAAGRLVRQKGLDILLRAFAGSDRARGLKLVILGEGPLRDALAAEAARLGVANRVIFPGFQGNPWAWFARARLFVLSSRWEGFGNVVAEAMACGAPTLVTDCDFGPREQVEHGATGWVTRTGDAEAMAADMDFLLANPGLSARLGAAASVRARDFDSHTIAAAYTTFFREVAASDELENRTEWAGTPTTSGKARRPAQKRTSRLKMST